MTNAATAHEGQHRLRASGAATVSRVWWQAYRVPFVDDFVAAFGVERAREGFLIGVECVDGTSGLGEAAPLPAYAGGTMAETANAIATLAAALVGSPAEEAWDRAPALPGVSAGAAAAARCGMETATADLMASRSDISLAYWLADRNGPGNVLLATSVPVNATIDAKDAGMAAEAARRFVAAGFDTLKLKVGVDAEGDLLRVAAVRKAIGPHVVLRIDANGGWSFAEAARLLPLYADLGVRLCEQPSRTVQRTASPS